LEIGCGLSRERDQLEARQRVEHTAIRRYRLLKYYITRRGPGGKRPITMTPKREYPERPLVGIGGVVVHEGRALLIRRGGPPLQGEWSIPGGMLEIGETLEQGVKRELSEETGLDVNVVELIEVFERIFPAPPNSDGSPGDATRPQYHFVILDYLCEMRGGTLAAGSDALEFAWTPEEELVKFNLTVAATRVLRKAFALTRERAAR
jgi:8-oxo-dGTP diphosphatase